MLTMAHAPCFSDDVTGNRHIPVVYTVGNHFHIMVNNLITMGRVKTTALTVPDKQTANAMDPLALRIPYVS
jgi:hypothetical protein